MNRFQASGIHFGISVLVLACFFALTFFGWYPAPYFTAEGTYSVIILLIAVDVVLGPLLTLVVFNTKKPELKYDLGIIALIQIVALLYGANTIYQERPYFVAFAVDQFVIVQASEAKKMQRLDELSKKINTAHLGPTYVYAERPTDPKQKQKILFDSLEGRGDIDRHPELYRPLPAYIKKSFDRSIKLDFLAKFHPENATIVEAFRQRYPNTERFAFFPLLGKNQDAALAIDRQTGEVVDYIKLNPFPARKPKKPVSPPSPEVTKPPAIKAP